MTINTKELINFVGELCKQEGLKVCIIGSAKSAAITGTTTFIGGIVGGPIGSTVGGICGSLISYAHSRGKYISAFEVIFHQMTPTQRENLANNIKRFINDLEIEDASFLMPLVMSNIDVKDSIVKEVFTFFSNDMKLNIAQ